MKQDKLIELYIITHCSPIYPPDFDSLRYCIKMPEWSCLARQVFQSIEVSGNVNNPDIVLGFWHCEDYHAEFEIRVSQDDRRLAKIKLELQASAKKGCQFLLLDYLIDFWKSEREDVYLEQGEEILFNWGMYQIENFLGDRPITSIRGGTMDCLNPLGFVERTICEVLEPKKSNT